MSRRLREGGQSHVRTERMKRRGHEPATGTASTESDSRRLRPGRQSHRECRSGQSTVRIDGGQSAVSKRWGSRLVVSVASNPTVPTDGPRRGGFGFDLSNLIG